MNLNNFDDKIDSTILSRGYDYFLDNAVTHLQDMKFGTWASLVEGNQDYSVVIKLDKDEIIEWDCNCPYDHGPVCKHVVATLYALGDGEEIFPKAKKKKKPKKRATNKNKVDEIFTKVDKQELQDFILQQFPVYRGIKNSFIAYFAEYLDEDINKKYQTIVKNIYISAKGSYGFIDYRSTYKLERPIIELINKAYDLSSRSKVTEALAISKSIIENIPKFIHNMDDSDGSAGGLFSDAFDLFSGICVKAHPELKDELFSYCLKELPKEKYSDFCFESNFLSVLPLLITTKKQENQYLKILDKQIDKAKLDENDYSLTQFLVEKINYYLNSKQEELAQDLIQKYIDYSEIRKIKVKQAILAKDYSLVKELCEEGIEIANKKRHPGTTNYWHEKLLETAKLEKNNTGIRKWTEVLFNNSYHNMDYYQQLKATYTNKEWVEKCEFILDDIKEKNKFGGLSAAQEIADIFVTEKYYDRLLKLMQLNADKIELIDGYSKHLIKLYPDELIKLYAQSIKKYAEQTGRSFYNQVVKYMKTLTSISNSENTIKELITFFKQTYKNRRAMMEVLNKSFPN